MSVELLLALAGAVAAIVSGFWAVATVAGKQFEKRLDERFAAQDKARMEGRQVYEQRLSKAEERLSNHETRFLEFLAELPTQYVRREDQIRFETVINAKLDALAAKQDLLAERLPRRD